MKFAKKPFARKNTRNLHIAVKHGKEKLPLNEEVKLLQCDICEKSFQSKQALISHKSMVHFRKQSGNNCDFCERHFADKHKLKCHVSKVHKNQMKAELKILENNISNCENYGKISEVARREKIQEINEKSKILRQNSI